MKAYKITFRNYVVGTDAIERSVTVKGWLRKCVTLRSLQRDKKLIVSVDKVDISVRDSYLTLISKYAII